MGFLIHGGIEVEFDDRLLAHLQIVIVQKFRRGDSLVISWLDALAAGDGRSSMWMTPHLPAYFKFAGSRSPAINREWLHLLTQSADTSTGLVVTDANGQLIHAGTVHRRL